MTHVLGIDPGKKGALALYDTDTGSLVVEDVPVLSGVGGVQVDVYALARMIDAWVSERPGLVVWIERASFRPTDGKGQVADTHTTYGLLIGLCVASFLTVERVTPQSWKRALGLPAGSTKDDSRARASQLLPKHSGLWPLKKHDGRAEAALIALYGARQAVAS